MYKKKLIEKLKKREAKYRKQIGTAKQSGDEMAEKYFMGHAHEIESLLFILKEA